MQDELLHALKRRDPDALAQVFQLYSAPLYRLGLSLLHDEQLADSVVQETFLRLIEHIDTFEGRSYLKTWLYRVAYNEALMYLRRKKPEVPLEDDESEVMPANFIDWRAVPEDIISSSEAMAEMERAVACLTPTLRAVFTLRDVEEVPTRETAEILGISDAAVKVRLHRARLLLREQLADYFERAPKAKISMNCEQLIHYLSDYIDRELSDDLVEAAQQHLHTCQNCRIVLDSTQKTLVFFKEKPRREIPAQLNQKLFSEIVKAFSKKRM